MRTASPRNQPLPGSAVAAQRSARTVVQRDLDPAADSGGKTHSQGEAGAPTDADFHQFAERILWMTRGEIRFERERTGYLRDSKR
jgi:hypothetical protein